MSAGCDQVRQTRRELPRLHQTGINPNLATRLGSGICTGVLARQRTRRGQCLTASNERNNVPDPQIRSLGHRSEASQQICKPSPLCPQRRQWLSTPIANHFLVVQRDDGMFAVGWDDDAAGPFESRSFAEAVAARTDSDAALAAKAAA